MQQKNQLVTNPGDFYAQISKKINHIWRVEFPGTMNKFSKKYNYSQSSVRAYRDLKMKPNAHFLACIALEYGKNLDWLIFDIGPESSVSIEELDRELNSIIGHLQTMKSLIPRYFFDIIRHENPNLLRDVLVHAATKMKDLLPELEKVKEYEQLNKRLDRPLDQSD